MQRDIQVLVADICWSQLTFLLILSALDYDISFPHAVKPKKKSLLFAHDSCEYIS